jgi:hypothetical protein
MLSGIAKKSSFVFQPLGLILTPVRYMKHVLFLLVSFVFVGCQIDGLDPLNTRTVVPDLNARVARKIFVGNDGKTVYNEASYQYNTSGQLERIDSYSRSANGQPYVYFYELYEYDASGSLSRKTGYNRSTGMGDFKATGFTVYTYPAIDHTTETSYYIVGTNSPNTSARTETFTKEGRVSRVERYAFDSKQQPILQNTAIYTYQEGRLVKEEFKDPTGKLYSTQEYSYKGRMATVVSFYPGAKGSYPAQTLEYDRRGRLIRQQYGGINDYLWSSSYRIGISSSLPAITIFVYDN